MDALQAWAREELHDADFGHAARATRAVAVLTQLAATPAGTVSNAFRAPAAREGAYRFCENGAIPWTVVAAAPHAACAVRCRGHACVIVPTDGSSLAHTDRAHTHGVGRVGSDRVGGRGLKSMLAVALSYDGVPLGVAAHHLWARSDVPDPTPHARRDLAAKESRHWTDLMHDFEASLAAAGAATVPWYQLDREADASHVLLRGLEPGVLFTVRAHQDRLLTAQAGRRHHLKLHAALVGAPPVGVIYLDVAAGPARVARIARLEVRVVHVGVRLRALWSKRALADVPLTAVHVREVGTCPAGAAPLDWLLLTTFRVVDFDDAVRVVRAYALRWVVERVHYTWKTGTCHVEDAQLRSFNALAKWATLHLSVAVHRQHLLHLARTRPELPADEACDRDTIDAALTLFTEHRADAPKPGTTPTLGTLVEIIARLGGYTGKSSGGPPGIKVLQRGLERVEVVALAFRLQRQLAVSPTPTDGFG